MKLKTIQPYKLPVRTLKWECFIDVLGSAHEVLARFDETLKSVEHPKKVFSLLSEEEAFSSLHNHHRPSSFEEWLLFRAMDRESEMETMLNYRTALFKAERLILKQPITLALIRKMHGMVRGMHEEVGFRTQQNWIGPEGCTIEKAYFYPPAPQLVPKFLDNWIKYLGHKEKDALVQLAIFFAQFLVIHPFMDGNGRVARLFIPLFLFRKKITSLPMFYLSDFFKRHRVNYFEKLYAITSKGKWEDWIHFFLTGIVEDGTRMLAKARLIRTLYEKFQVIIPELGVSKELVDLLFKSPILNREKWRQYESEFQKLEKEKLICFYRGKSMVAVRKLLTIDKVSTKNHR
jgi:Fic family protein